MSKLTTLTVAYFLLGLCGLSWAQGGATGERLVVETNSLPTGYLHQQYRIQLQGHGGITPLKWTLASGKMPPGIQLSDDGLLSGIPSEAGDFHFVVTMTDSGKPAQQINQELTLRIVAALLLQWSHPAKVSGAWVDGSVKVSNQTGDDFDLTVIIVAVNGIGRATAIGYQHFVLKKGTTDLEIPFGENLPRGAYELNVDAVGEVAVVDRIYRERLTDKLQVQQGP